MDNVKRDREIRYLQMHGIKDAKGFPFFCGHGFYYCCLTKSSIYVKVLFLSPRFRNVHFICLFNLKIERALAMMAGSRWR